MEKLSIIFAAALAALAFPSCCPKKADPAQTNPVIEAIMGRRSIRVYKDEPVERGKLQLIAECGINAPNGMNRQQWELRILDNAEIIDSITEKFKAANPEMVSRDPGFKNMFRNAPVVIFVAQQEGKDGVDIGLLGQNITLSAYSLGLGTVIMQGPLAWLKNSEEGQKFLASLGFSEGYVPAYVVGVGYPDETPDAKPRDVSKIKFVD